MSAFISLATGIVLMGSAPFWWDEAVAAFDTDDQNGSTAATESPTPEPPPATEQPEVTPLIGGCPGGYQLYAQNRWDPNGAAVRESPTPAARQVASIPGNGIIHVDGWAHGPVAYPTNSAPWNSDVWFHLTDGTGWVSFAGVRAVPTDDDPTNRSPDGGIAATTPPECEGSY